MKCRERAMHIECSDDSIRALFRERDVRYTRQRAVIYRALASTDQHPTAEDLFSAVRLSESGMSLATVYNTLDLLTASGLCRRLPASPGAGPCRYDADVSPHVHVVVESGGLMDVPDDLSRQLLSRVGPETLAELEARLGVRITGVDLRLTGTRQNA
ncbi:MAG: transcriptional repressor [Phycisphaeraceae bacterium]|nr:transcriptional repressor [Phycisphaeraceae bacterium]MCW5762634.1 transcriptional repressor [Phycisphaeraceae bacterium]